MSEHRVTLLGAKGSGKSTWLAMLGEALDLGHVRRFAPAPSQPSDRRAWEQLADPVREGRYADRTPDVGAFPQVRLRTQGGWTEPRELVLEAADYRGEELEHNFLRRNHAWTEAWERRASADSFVVVVRPESLVDLPSIPPPTMGERQALQALLAAFPAPSVRVPVVADVEPTDVAPSLSDPAEDSARSAAAPRQIPPTLLTVIEILQMVRATRGWSPGRRPDRVRLGVVLSGWDGLDAAASAGGPDRYLYDRLPLLADFIWSNFEPELVRCFGHSSTGGDLNDEAYREIFQHRDAPASRVCWSTAGDQVRSDDDVSLPFAWLLAGDDALDAGV